MNTKNWILTVLASFIAAIGFASSPKMNVVPMENEKALLTFESSDPSTFVITVTSEQGEIVYFLESKKHHSAYKQVFDFSLLGDGNYTICMNYGNRSISRDLDVTEEGIEVGPPKRCYEPYYKVIDGKLNVSFLNVAGKQVYMNIYKDGSYVTGLNLGKKMTIQKRFDLNELEKGEYEIVLTDWFKDHRYYVQI